jgi:excisionase family DNA binding protein
MNDLELLTRDEVCNLLRISLQTLHSWNKKGILTPIKLGTRIRYRKSDIDAVLINNTINNG